MIHTVAAPPPIVVKCGGVGVLRMFVCGVVLVVSCVVLFVLCVCVCDLFLFLQEQGGRVSVEAKRVEIQKLMFRVVYVEIEGDVRPGVGVGHL